MRDSTTPKKMRLSTVFKPTLPLVSKTMVGQYIVSFVNMDFGVSEHRYNLQIANMWLRTAVH